MREFGGRGWAIYDARPWRKIKTQIKDQTQVFQRLQLWYLLTIGHKKAATIEAIAQRFAVDDNVVRRIWRERPAGLGHRYRERQRDHR